MELNKYTDIPQNDKGSTITPKTDMHRALYCVLQVQSNLILKSSEAPYGIFSAVMNITI